MRSRTPAAPPKFNLRLPEELRRRLDECANENNRSLNQEIINRLRRSLEGWKQ